MGRGFKVPSFDQHPAKIFFAENLPFSLSCDNILLSGDMEIQADPLKEVGHLAYDVMDDVTEGWRAVRYSLVSGLRAGFSPAIDASYLREFEETVDKVFEKYGIKL